MAPLTSPTRSLGRRLAITALVALLAVQMAGCSTTRIEGETRLRNQEVARIGRGADWLLGRAGHLGNVTFDGVTGDLVTYKWIEPGRHRIDVPASWSNKFEDRTTLEFDALRGRKYVVLIYELAPGQDRTAIEIRPATFGESLARRGLPGESVLGAMVLLVALPWVIADLSKDAAKKRPFEGCCFVWVQDEDSGDVVAGASPRSSR